METQKKIAMNNDITKLRPNGGCVNVEPFQPSDTFATTTTYGDMEINYVEPCKDCSHLCYDCERGSYCWDSECNEVSNL